MTHTSHQGELTSTMHDSVREYYGKVLSSSDDLKTNACCPADAMPRRIRDIVELIEPEIVERFYGCGSPIPPAVEGRTVLDLGCGTGRDAFICSRLVGEDGMVIGVDMTDEQLEVGRRNLASQTDRFGYRQPNVALLKGFMEDLGAIGITDESVDVVISNCVINLSPDKEQVFREIFRVLRPGGELLFSDIFADRRLPGELREDQILVGECLGGALYVEDFRRLLAGLGVPDYRIVSQRPVTIDNPELEARVGNVGFSSVTVRAFKLESLEDRCEDYGQIARYRGSVNGLPYAFPLDDHHLFERDKPVPVCGNTAAMLSETRLAVHFDVTGDHGIHFGLFDCDDQTSASNEKAASGCC